MSDGRSEGAVVVASLCASSDRPAVDDLDADAPPADAASACDMADPATEPEGTIVGGPSVSEAVDVSGERARRLELERLHLIRAVAATARGRVGFWTGNYGKCGVDPAADAAARIGRLPVPEDREPTPRSWAELRAGGGRCAVVFSAMAASGGGWCERRAGWRAGELI